MEIFSQSFKTRVTPEDFVAYAYGVLAHPAFCATFSGDLAARELRTPITKDPALFKRVRRIGARLLWLHTFGERFVPTGVATGQVQPGSTRCITAVPSEPMAYPESFSYDADSQTLQVGAGRFAPVRPEVLEFEVSGLSVVKSWLGYRMKRGSGRKSSPLNDIRPSSWTSAFTAELLELLWVLEATMATYPQQAKLLEEIVSGDCFSYDDLPTVPHEARKPPSPVRTTIDHLAF